jgi:hypothetical protein
MALDITKDGNEWNSHPPEDNMEWICSVIPLIIKFSKCKGINTRGVYDELNDFYKEETNLGELIQEVLAKAISNNEIR